MSKLLAPSQLQPKRPSRGRPVHDWEKDEEKKSLLIGLLLTLLLWPLLVGGFAWAIGHLHGVNAVQLASSQRKVEPKELNIELAPEEPLPNRNPFKFVETNPNVPDNEPTKTDNYAAKNQQAAQEKPDATTTGDHAKLDGKDIPSQQVVVGNPTKPQEAAPETPPPEVPQTENKQSAPKQEQTPLPGFEKKEADNPDGIGSNLAKVADNHQQVQEEVKGEKNPSPNAATSTTQATKPQPKPRPRLQAVAPPGVLAKNDFGTTNMGPAAYDARWSEFGEYMQQMVDIIRSQWYKLVEESRVTPPSGSHVSVQFRINSKGEISEILNVEETAGKQGTYACTSAITIPAPYRTWTPQMIAVLGDDQVITFTFYYF